MRSENGFEAMKELTKKILAVPKADALKQERKRRKKRPTAHKK